MITRENYLKKIEEIDFKSLDKDILFSKEFFDKATSNGTNWEYYESDEQVKEAIDLYLEALNNAIESIKEVQKKSSPVQKASKTTSSISEKDKDFYVDLVEKAASFDPKIVLEAKSIYQNLSRTEKEEMHEYIANDYGAYDDTTVEDSKSNMRYLLSKKRLIELEDEWDSKKNKRKPFVPKPSSKKTSSASGKKVEHISSELKFLKSFVNMHGKVKSRHQIRLFINRLQKAIQEKRITKKSKYANEIMDIQEKLIAFHGRFENDDQLEPVVFKEETRTKFLKLIGEEQELQSIKFIKSYINLQGKMIPNKKALNLFNRIEKSIAKGVLDSRDKYWKEVETILNHLETFVRKNPNQGILKVESRTLNGLNGIVLGCACEPLSGTKSNLPDYLDIEDVTRKFGEGTKSASDTRFMMSSEDLMNVNFNHVGLKEKWLEFIGDPEIGFRIAIFGAPKMGKSYLMIEFAGYLAANHGRVIYVAKEEGKSATLKKKLRETASMHPNFMVSNYIPENLDEFDFCFFDSVTKLGLNPKNLIAIKAAFPMTSMVEVHQVTKDGKARGLNDFIHDVDGVIEVYEKGKASQYGRFNQGGELDFFDEDAA